MTFPVLALFSRRTLVGSRLGPHQPINRSTDQPTNQPPTTTTFSYIACLPASRRRYRCLSTCHARARAAPSRGISLNRPLSPNRTTAPLIPRRSWAITIRPLPSRARRARQARRLLPRQTMLPAQPPTRRLPPTATLISITYCLITGRKLAPIPSLPTPLTAQPPLQSPRSPRPPAQPSSTVPRACPAQLSHH